MPAKPESAGSWFVRLGTATIMIALAAIVASLLAAAGARGFLPNRNGPFEPEQAGFYVTGLLICTAWALPSMSMRFKTLDIAPGRRGHISYLIAVTVIIAAALTAASAFWPLFTDFPVSDRFVDDWQPTADRLAAVFLLCWTASLASLGAAIVIPHLLKSREALAMALGLPLFLIGLGTMAGLIFFLKELPASQSGLIFVITGIAIPVLLILDSLIGVLTVATYRRIAERDADLSGPPAGAPVPASP